ncbi:hypothetical protein ACFB49_33440 [Sphingomonas sp. DBB INV C78]|uniref:hypothetical protein n=1 Tax=Sphingomonas sp. DBB INV C78 TaxID=3349434 RepID=UPI0036D35ABD
MEKLCFVFRHDDGPSPDRLAKARSFAEVARDLARAVTLHVADPPLATPSATLGSDDPADMAIFDPALYALASIWIDTIDDRAPLEAEAALLPGQFGVYLVTESAVLDYDSMSWAVGEPSPGKTLVALFRRHPALTPERFRQRWAAHSSMSCTIHPLSRYLRNDVVHSLAGDAIWDGVVEERVADVRDLAPERFYIGEGSRELAAKDIAEFIDVENGMKCSFMTEIIYKPPPWLAQDPPSEALCR